MIKHYITTNVVLLSRRGINKYFKIRGKTGKMAVFEE